MNACPGTPAEPERADAEQEYMLIDFKILLPADIRALAKLPRELEAALKRTGLAHSPIMVSGRPDTAAAAPCCPEGFDCETCAPVAAVPGKEDHDA